MLDQHLKYLHDGVELLIYYCYLFIHGGFVNLSRNDLLVNGVLLLLIKILLKAWDYWMRGLLLIRYERFLNKVRPPRGEIIIISNYGSYCFSELPVQRSIRCQHILTIILNVVLVLSFREGENLLLRCIFGTSKQVFLMVWIFL